MSISDILGSIADNLEESGSTTFRVSETDYGLSEVMHQNMNKKMKKKLIKMIETNTLIDRDTHASNTVRDRLRQKLKKKHP